MIQNKDQNQYNEDKRWGKNLVTLRTEGIFLIFFFCSSWFCLQCCPISYPAFSLTARLNIKINLFVRQNIRRPVSLRNSLESYFHAQNEACRNLYHELKAVHCQIPAKNDGHRDWEVENWATQRTHKCLEWARGWTEHHDAKEGHWNESKGNVSEFEGMGIISTNI